MTFNTKLLPYLPGKRKRARALASRILAGDYDIIGLTEVFSEAARRILSEALRHEYPWGVLRIGSRRPVREDSGLMVLSRFPLEMLPADRRYLTRGASVHGDSLREGAPYVWFAEFDRCLGSDCLAGKGAAYLRLRVRGRLLHLFLAHFQASYAHHGAARQERTMAARREQADQLRHLAAAALAERTGSDEVIIFGDINVDGCRTGTERPAPENEWAETLDRLGAVVPGGLVDVWDHCAPAADSGYTYPAARPAARRDYILVGSAGALEAQHVRLALDLWDPAATDAGGGRGIPMSDHLGIVADLNTAAPGSRPTDAHCLSTDRIDAPLYGRISHPGGLQWYRLVAPTPMRLTVEVTGTDGGDPQVYAAHDISRPLIPVDREAGATAPLKSYRLNGESYVRVGDARSMAMGDFEMHVSRI